MNTRKAVVFGATGLVGKSVVRELANNPVYIEIKIFSRRLSEISGHSKIVEKIVDFKTIDSFAAEIQGDDLFICLGTTIKKAGSVEQMEKIDRDLPVTIAKKASENGMKRVAIISSIGADAKSSNYYLRIKGEMEQEIMKLDFVTTGILRPSLLLGKRDDTRVGEQAGKAFMKIFGMLLPGSFKKYRAIGSNTVARAMVYILDSFEGKQYFESDQILLISRGHK